MFRKAAAGGALWRKRLSLLCKWRASQVCERLTIPRDIMFARLLMSAWVSCALACNSARPVRLDTGEGRVVSHTAQSAPAEVKLEQRALVETMSWLLQDIRLSSNPLRDSKRTL